MTDNRLCNGSRRFACSAEGSKWSFLRYSLGIFAGYWCDTCWPKAGYRMEVPEAFDPMDAGESYDPEEPNDLADLNDDF